MPFNLSWPAVMYSDRGCVCPSVQTKSLSLRCIKTFFIGPTVEAAVKQHTHSVLHTVAAG